MQVPTLGSALLHSFVPLSYILVAVAFLRIVGEECGLENGLVSMFDQIVFGHSSLRLQFFTFKQVKP